MVPDDAPHASVAASCLYQEGQEEEDVGGDSHRVEGDNDGADVGVQGQEEVAVGEAVPVGEGKPCQDGQGHEGLEGATGAGGKEERHPSDLNRVRLSDERWKLTGQQIFQKNNFFPFLPDETFKLARATNSALNM